MFWSICSNEVSNCLELKMVFQIPAEVGQQDKPYLSDYQQAKWLVTFCEVCIPGLGPATLHDIVICMSGLKVMHMKI